MAEQHLTLSFDSSITATTELLTAIPTKIYYLGINNLSNAMAYLQLFDAAATASVTLGTTAPTLSIAVHQDASGNNGNKDLIFNNPLNFKYGVVYAITTTATGSTAPSAACQTNFGYV